MLSILARYWHVKTKYVKYWQNKSKNRLFVGIYCYKKAKIANKMQIKLQMPYKVCYNTNK